jgi:hypothetical protein
MSYKTKRIKILVTKDKAKPQHRECKGLNLVAVRLVNVQWKQVAVQQNRGQRANSCTRAEAKAVMCATHIALNTLIIV